jgi:hypothetical protein
MTAERLTGAGRLSRRSVTPGFDDVTGVGTPTSAYFAFYRSRGCQAFSA